MDIVAKAKSTVAKISDLILDPILLLLMGLSMVYFFWGLIIFILKSDSNEERTAGKKHMIFSLVGFVIIFSVWGIINLVIGTIETVST